MTSKKRLSIVLIALLTFAIPTGALWADGQNPEREVAQTFHLENIQVKDAMTILRSILGLHHVAANEDHSSLTVRDDPATVDAAARLLGSIDKARAEVELDVQVLEIDRTDHTQEASAPQRLTAKEWTQLRARGTVVARSQLSALDGTMAEAQMGDTLMVDGQGISVGLEMRVVPQVHRLQREMTLDVDLAISGITGWLDLGQGRKPVIGERDLDAFLRLGEGTTWVLRGFLEGSDGAVEGLEGLPPLTRLLASRSADKELIVAVTPKLVRLPDYGALDLVAQEIPEHRPRKSKAAD